MAECEAGRVKSRRIPAVHLCCSCGYVASGRTAAAVEAASQDHSAWHAFVVRLATTRIQGHA
jgi:hypothetical protein